MLIKDYVPNAADWRVTVAGGGGERVWLMCSPPMKRTWGDGSGRPTQARLSGYVVRAGDSKVLWLAGHGNDTFQTPVNFSVSYLESRNRGTLEFV